jgi:hypothetical protein
MRSALRLLAELKRPLQLVPRMSRSIIELPRWLIGDSNAGSLLLAALFLWCIAPSSAYCQGTAKKKVQKPAKVQKLTGSKAVDSKTTDSKATGSKVARPTFDNSKDTDSDNAGSKTSGAKAIRLYSTDSDNAVPKATGTKPNSLKDPGSEETDPKEMDGKSTSSEDTDSKDPDSEEAAPKTTSPKTVSSKTTATKSTSSKAGDSKSTGSKSTDSKPTNSKGTGSKASDLKTASSKATTSKSPGAKTTGAKTTGAKATVTKAKGGGGEDAAIKLLEELDFGAAKPNVFNAEEVTEPDETNEGLTKLEAIQEQIKEIFAERKDTAEEYATHSLHRNQLLEQVQAFNNAITTGQQTILQLQNEARRLQQNLQNNVDTQGAQAEIGNINVQIRNINRLISENELEIRLRTPKITDLNGKISPLEAQLVKLWLDLNTCRQQWLEIRQPQQKYANGDYEGLKQAIDDWLLMDNLWPEALCWAALCRYELGDYQAAWDHVEQASGVRQSLNFPKAWAQGEALRGLIAAKLPEYRGKAANHVQLANVYVAKDKKTNWVVFFILGRAQCDNEKLAGKAKANFEKALKINSGTECVQYWYARLKTSTTVASVRDVEAGTKTLEELWKHSTKKSWRLAFAMVLAYDSGNRAKDANEAWDIVQSLAAANELEKLQQERVATQAKLKPEAAPEPAEQAKKVEPKGNTKSGKTPTKIAI